MRTAIFLSIAFIIFLVPILLIFWFQSSACSATTVASASPTITVVATPSPAAGSTQLNKITTCIDNTNKIVISPLQALVTLLATWSIVVLAILLIWRIWKLSRVSNLVIDTFNNATQKDDLSKVLSGLNQLTRERLAQVLEEVRIRMNMYRATNDPLNRFPVPRQAFDQPLTSLLASLKTVTTGEMSTAIQLLSLLFTPRGTKVTATLQSRGDLPIILGISVEVLDLEGKKEPVLQTFWEQAVIHQGGIPPVAAPPLTAPPDVAEEAHAYYILGHLYEGRGALEEAKTQYENALEKLPTYDDAKDALRRVLDVRKTLEDRYLELTEPMAYWLAIQIAERSLEDEEQSISYQVKRLLTL